MQLFHAERMTDMRNTQRVLVEKPGGRKKCMGPMIRKKKAMKEENGFGGKLL
jgi:hypothetical protein